MHRLDKVLEQSPSTLCAESFYTQLGNEFGWSDFVPIGFRKAQVTSCNAAHQGDFYEIADVGAMGYDYGVGM